MILSFMNIRKVPRDLANVNEWKILFDPYNSVLFFAHPNKKYMPLTHSVGTQPNWQMKVIVKISLIAIAKENNQFNDGGPDQRLFIWHQPTSKNIKVGTKM